MRVPSIWSQEVVGQPAAFACSAALLATPLVMLWWTVHDRRASLTQVPSVLRLVKLKAKAVAVLLCCRVA